MATCLSCTADSWSPIPGELVKCVQCGFVMAAHVPSADELAKLYQQEYFFGQEYFDYAADRPALETNFRRRLDELPQLFQSGANVVEIGCAYGFFLGLIKDTVGWHRGYDVSEDGVRFATEELKVNATTTPFLDDEIEPASIDTVAMWDVIEHLREPDLFIEKVAQIVRPGGHVVLTTGDISATIARLRGAKWRMIHPPTHLYYFDPKTITNMLGRYGFVVETVTYPGVSRNLGSVAHQLLMNRRVKTGATDGGESRAETFVDRLPLSRMNITVNTRDIMQVTARRIAAAR